MSPDAGNRYRAALEPWVRKAEREHKVINYVRYRDGRAGVAMISRKEAKRAVAPPDDEVPTGALLI